MRKKSKEIRSQLAEDQEEKITCIGSTIPVHDDVINDKVVGTLIREAHAQQLEEECVKIKTHKHWNWINMEAKNAFHEGVGAGTVKCVIGHNHCNYRNKKINNELIDSRCPRCNEIETWEHVTLCEVIETMKKT